jgi:hypothetical protein
MHKTRCPAPRSAFERDISVAKSGSRRGARPALAALFVAVAVAVAEGCSTGSSPPTICLSGGIELHFPSGASSVAAISAVGACSIDALFTCEPADPGCDAGACACDVAVQLVQLAAGGNCHIEVTSVAGAIFKVDAPVQVVGGPCGPEGVGLVNPSQSQITVDFSADGGVVDGAVDGGAG